MGNDKWAAFYPPLSIEDYIYNASRHRFMLAKILAMKPNRVLEVGTGSGGLGIFLSQTGIPVVSVERNADVLDNARRNNDRLRGKVDFNLADAFAGLSELGEFDVAFSQGVAEHFDDSRIRLFVRNQLAVSPCVMISIPNRSYWRSFGDERLMTADEWAKILKEFKIHEIMDYGVEIPGRSYLKHKLMRLRVLDIFRPHHIYIEIVRQYS